MSYLVASSDSYDGYLSDVPSQASNAPSEISQDLVASTKVLEKHFKDKYKVLRSAYEQRIKQLSEVVQETCANLFSDELLNEMKNDKTSSAFIPAHLSEIIDRHMESEREKFIHQAVTKLASLELELGKTVDANSSLKHKISLMEKDVVKGKKAEMTIPPLREKLNNIENQYKEYLKRTENEMIQLKNDNARLVSSCKQLQNRVDMVTHDLAEKTAECEQHRASSQEKQHEVTMLEQSFEQSARELAIIEGMQCVYKTQHVV